MQLTLSKTAVIGTLLLSLVNISSGFLITVFENPDCSGNARDINIYDNSCHTPANPGFAGFKVKTYGGGNQRAYFFRPGSCGDITNSHNWWADGGSDTFMADRRCLSAGVGNVWNAVASCWVYKRDEGLFEGGGSPARYADQELRGGYKDANFRAFTSSCLGLSRSISVTYCHRRVQIYWVGLALALVGLRVGGLRRLC